jgi:hypothetical protein
MFWKTAFVVVSLAVFGGVVAACTGPLGKGEGDSCDTNDQCSEGLDCQPIGDGGDYCCPTPAQSSSKATCQGGNSGNGS